MIYFNFYLVHIYIYEYLNKNLFHLLYVTINTYYHYRIVYEKN